MRRAVTLSLDTQQLSSEGIPPARTGPGLAQLRGLIAGADVMLHGYRPGALDSLRLDEQTRASLRPGLVDVTLNAYGWTSPWSDRRGFDTLVPYSGIAHEISRWALEEPEGRLPLNALGHRVDASRPRHMPVEALDFSAGYQLAAAALLGLVRRMRGRCGVVDQDVPGPGPLACWSTRQSIPRHDVRSAVRGRTAAESDPRVG